MSKNLKKSQESQKSEWKLKYELVPEDDPILRETLSDFNFLDPPVDPIELAHELAQHCMHYAGIGLASNQIGLPYRAFCILAQEIIVAYNPVIVDRSETKQYEMEEACLSLPGIVAKVKRPESIKVRYTLPNSERITRIYTGMTARVMQHEIDHLNGILFIDHLSKLAYDMALKKAEKRNG